MITFLRTSILMLALFPIQKILAQQVAFVDTFRYGNNLNNLYGPFFQTSDSGFMISGTTGTQPFGGSNQSFLEKIDRFGNKQWQRLYGMNDNQISFIDQINDSSFIFSGIFNWYVGKPNIDVGKMNMNGDTLWIKNYGYPPQIWPCFPGAIYKDKGNGFIMTNWYAADYGLLKLDSSGNCIWHRSSGFGFNCYQIIPDPNGGYILCGADNNLPYSVQRLDKDGNTLWKRTYGKHPNSNQVACASRVIVQSDSNYVVSCFGKDWQLMKVRRKNGKILWKKYYPDGPFSSLIIPNLVADAGDDKLLYVSQNYFMLLDANGDSIWKRTMPFPYMFILQAIKTMDGGYAFAGGFENINLNLNIGCFFKTDSMGNILTTSIFDIDSKINMAVFPNPASSNLYLNTMAFATEPIITFTLTDLQGKQVIQQEFDKTKAVDVSNLPNGIYIAEVRGKEKVVRGKVVVQH